MPEREASERLKEGHQLASDIVQPEGPSISSSSSTYIPTMMTLPGGLGGEFATEAAMRGFGYARDSMATYAFGNAAAGAGAGGLEQAPEDAVNEDILRPHVKRFVSGVMGQGQTASPIAAAGSASITELDSTQGPTTTTTTAEEGVDLPLAGKKGKGGEKKKEKGKPAAGKSKTSKLRDKWEEFKVVHGTGLIVVLDDLAVSLPPPFTLPVRACEYGGKSSWICIGSGGCRCRIFMRGWKGGFIRMVYPFQIPDIVARFE
ncbi:hypothetical protein QFC22_001996 [Naganishia vaughanmartiniae]|uniref:Uncharacterized protein n=1 Tax=Naganishia vaughanmartiniae TaxID=1424756 RepID=A0ACC2XIM5_9TREE|nr:hypothetical protein QFC22_001996 [Naganishia vaughanmartiniae]